VSFFVRGIRANSRRESWKFLIPRIERHLDSGIEGGLLFSSANRKEPASVWQAIVLERGLRAGRCDDRRGDARPDAESLALEVEPLAREAEELRGALHVSARERRGVLDHRALEVLRGSVERLIDQISLNLLVGLTSLRFGFSRRRPAGAGTRSHAA